MTRQPPRYAKEVKLLDELTTFPHGAHDDCVDALSGAHNLLVWHGSGQMTVHVPRGRIPLAQEADLVKFCLQSRQLRRSV